MSTIKIATGPARVRTTSRQAKRVEVETLWYEKGLAVHKAHNATGWVITHLASGYSVLGGIRSHRNAITVAKRLLDAGDWTRSRSAVLGDANLRDRFAQIRSEAALLGLLR